MFWKTENIFSSLWCIAWSKMFLTSHDVHISSNEVQDRVASRSASGPLGMTVSRRRWRVITGYEENEFRRRYWTDSVWQRSIIIPKVMISGLNKKKNPSKSKTRWDSLNERHLVMNVDILMGSKMIKMVFTIFFSRNPHPTHFLSGVIY